MTKLRKTPLGLLCMMALAVLFCLYMDPAEAQATPIPMISGSSDWNFDAITGDLSITGSGKVAALYQNSVNDIPWYSNAGSIKSVRMDTAVQPTSTADWFAGCSTLTTTKSASWDVSQVTNMSQISSGCYALTNLTTNMWNTGAVTNMTGMFRSCEVMTQLDLSNLNTVAVTNMSEMFSDC